MVMFYVKGEICNLLTELHCRQQMTLRSQEEISYKIRSGGVTFFFSSNYCTS